MNKVVYLETFMQQLGNFGLGYAVIGSCLMKREIARDDEHFGPKISRVYWYCFIPFLVNQAKRSAF